MDEITIQSAEINRNFLETLTSTSLDLVSDIEDIFLDDFVKNTFLQDLPIVKGIFGIYKIGNAVNQFYFTKKVLIFIQQFNSGTIADYQFNEFKQKINSDYKYGQRIAEKLMVLIDKQIEISQTKITANLFKAYVEGVITYEEFNSIVITLNNLHPSTYNFFFELEPIDFNISESDNIRNWEMESMIEASGFGLRMSAWSSGFQLNQDAIKMFKYGLKPLREEQGD